MHTARWKRRKRIPRQGNASQQRQTRQNSIQF